MIDVHCHLEQKDYDKDRDNVVQRCKDAGLKALITVCAHPNDFEKSLQIVERYKGFVFLVAAIHPEYIKDISQSEIEKFFDALRKNKDRVIGIGEAGLDYFWIKEQEWREKQKELFVRFINLAKELKKPLTVHTRDAHEDVISILEQQDAKDVHLHMWGGNQQVKTIVERGWHISVGPIIERSKKHKKVVRDVPLDLILLETDSPWFGREVGLAETGRVKRERGDPTRIEVAAERIAEIKKISKEEVMRQAAKNAIRLWKLPVKLPIKL